MATVRVISPKDLPCDCMTPPLQCKVGSLAELPSCTTNGVTYVVDINGVEVVYYCSDGEWIPVARETAPIMAAMQGNTLNYPLPTVGSWNDITLPDIILDTGAMAGTNSITIPYRGIWTLGFMVQPVLPQLTVGNMVAQIAYVSTGFTGPLVRDQVNFETTNPPSVHYNLTAVLDVPIFAAGASIRLQVLPSHAGMAVDYRYMYAKLVSRLL